MGRGASLGIDLGTSGVKVALVDTRGMVLAVASRPFAVRSPQPSWAEASPEEWVRATRDAVGELLAGAPDVTVTAIGLDGQMHGVVLTRGTRPVREAILWPDARATAELDRWRSAPDEVRATLANPLSPGMAGPILAWLARHEPDALAAADVALAPKDWLRLQLVPDAPVTDPSDASATLLWDVPAGGWSAPFVAAAGIDPALLPAVRASGAAAGRLTAATAETWGLPAGIPVAVGCGDSAATLLAARPVSGQVTVTLGTGVQVVLPGAEPRADAAPVVHTFASADGRHYAMAAATNGGLALGRVVDLLGVSWAELYAALDRPRAGTGIFLPYFTAERLPRPVPAGTAGWRGLSLGSDRSTLLRTAVEAVAFLARRGLEALPAPSTGEVRLAGGGTRDRRVQQLLADVLGRPVRRCRTANLTALGAALLGWAAAGERVEPPVELEAPLPPAHSGAYEERYALFQQLTDEVADSPAPARSTVTTR